MALIDDIKRHKEKILMAAKRYGIYNIRVFGSCVHGNERPDSDIDLLIDIERDRSLMDLSGFKNSMEDLFERKVDVIIEDSLHWYIKDRVIKEAKPV